MSCKSWCGEIYREVDGSRTDRCNFPHTAGGLFGTVQYCIPPLHVQRRRAHNSAPPALHMQRAHMRAVVFDSVAELEAETNASLLHQYYHERQVRFRGIASRSPPWQGDPMVSDSISLADGTKLTVDQAAEAYELIISQLGGQPKALGGEGSVWNGVDTLIDPVDAAGLSALMWSYQPDLIVEIGTECGGSAVFFAMIMRQYTRSGRVITFDVLPQWQRCSKALYGRRTWKGYKSILWQQLVREGALIPRYADVNRASERALIARYAREAKRGVWVFDDGDHLATPIIVHFHCKPSHPCLAERFLAVAAAIPLTRLPHPYTCAQSWRGTSHLAVTTSLPTRGLSAPARRPSA